MYWKKPPSCINKWNNKFLYSELIIFKFHPLVCSLFAQNNQLFVLWWFSSCSIFHAMFYFLFALNERESRGKTFDFKQCNVLSVIFCDKNNITFDILLIVYNANQTKVCNDPFCYRRGEEIGLKRSTQQTSSFEIVRDLG